MAEIDTTYATIASLLPYAVIGERKPGVNPGEYDLKAAVNGEPGLTLIPNNAFYNINPDPLAESENVRYIPVPVPAIELAQSIINDYVAALLGVELPDAIPGLFCVRGNYSEPKIFKVKFASQIEICRQAQNRWFMNLVNMADDTWSKTRSPLSIGDLQRAACKSLGYEREWLNPKPSEEIPKCPMCKNAINLGAVKCVSCGFILDQKQYDLLTGVTK